MINYTLFLFKLIKDHNNPWKVEEMKKDKKGRLTILREMYISRTDWDKFMYFLRHKHPPYFGAWITTSFGKNNTSREELYNNIIVWLESVNETCNKLGGFPVFDKYLLFQF